MQACSGASAATTTAALGYRRLVSSVGPEAALPAASASGHADTSAGITAGDFHVHLAVFEGPFDLLLSLIAKRQLDVTLVDLAQVTDELIEHIKVAESD